VIPFPEETPSFGMARNLAARHGAEAEGPSPLATSLNRRKQKTSPEQSSQGSGLFFPTEPNQPGSATPVPTSPEQSSMPAAAAASGAPPLVQAAAAKPSSGAAAAPEPVRSKSKPSVVGALSPPVSKKRQVGPFAVCAKKTRLMVNSLSREYGVRNLRKVLRSRCEHRDRFTGKPTHNFADEATCHELSDELAEIAGASPPRLKRRRVITVALVVALVEEGARRTGTVSSSRCSEEVRKADPPPSSAVFCRGSRGCPRISSRSSQSGAAKP